MSIRWVVGGMAALALACGERAESDEGAIGRVRLPATPSMVWGEQARLNAPIEVSGDMFGVSMELEGTRAVVGASGKPILGERQDVGAVYVFERSGATWSQQAELVLA